MRLIDADRLEKVLAIMANQCGGTLDILDISNAIKIAPTVERPHGEWIKRFDDNEWYWYWYCTSCKTQWYEEDLYMGRNEFPNFCPNCGADMKEGEKNERS